MSNLLSLAGWAFLPNLVTGWIQSVWYGVSIRAGEPKPQPGSPRHIKDRQRIHIVVVSAYLLYTIYEADWNIRRAGDFYQDLGVPHSATDREIKSKFRRLAAIHHPDKVASNPGSEAYFVHLKLAQDTLLSPAKRFVYERFGPSMLDWQRCSSIKDYLMVGLQLTLLYYGAAAIAMYGLGLLGYLEWGKYWRWLIMLTLCIFELHTISRPYFPLIAENFINPLLTKFTSHPPYLPFQLISLGRQFSVTLYMAFSQIGPLLQPVTATPQANNPELALRQQLDRLEATAKAADLEASRLIGMEMSPFVGDATVLKDVQNKVKTWLVQNTIRADPEVRDAIGTMLKRRRVDAPAGARGNR
ncbi:hypothetical protein B7463_g10100, partial [Scytalidium lignicola]